MKVIDSPSDEAPADLGSAICSGTRRDAPEVEVAWSHGVRRHRRDLARTCGTSPCNEVARGGTWVVTGGGRGITSFAAVCLRRRYGLKIHMIGKSPAPDKTAPWLKCSDEELKKYKSTIVREAIAAGRSPEEDWDRIRKAREIEVVSADMPRPVLSPIIIVATLRTKQH